MFAAFSNAPPHFTCVFHFAGNVFSPGKQPLTPLELMFAFFHGMLTILHIGVAKGSLFGAIAAQFQAKVVFACEILCCSFSRFGRCMADMKVCLNFVCVSRHGDAQRCQLQRRVDERKGGAGGHGRDRCHGRHVHD